MQPENTQEPTNQPDNNLNEATTSPSTPVQQPQEVAPTQPQSAPVVNEAPAAPLTAPQGPQVTSQPTPNPASTLPPTQPLTPVGNPKKKRLLLAGIVAGVVLIGGSAGAYFGVVAPNQPDNLWKRALSNTNKGYDKLVTYSKDNKDKKGGTLKGSFKGDFASTVVDGSIDTKYYEKESQTAIDAGAAGTRFKLDLLTTAAPNSKNPDLYAKLSGLKGLDSILGAGSGDALASYDGQWYVVDHTLLDQAEKEAGGTSTMPSLSSEDVTTIAEAVGRVNKEYVFTTDPSKAVVTKKENIGKEKLDGRNTYHYQVGYNKDNLKAYVNAMAGELKKTKLKDSIKDSDVQDSIKEIDKLDGKDTADAWVDTKTKLIRQIRITDKEDKNNYADIRLNYNGGDELPFVLFINSADKDAPGKFTLSLNLNMKSSQVKFGVVYDGKSGSQNYNFKLDATLTPGNDKVTVTKPEGAKSLLEAYGQLIGQPGASIDSLQAQPLTSEL